MSCIYIYIIIISTCSSQTGTTALYVAVQNGHWRVVELLIAAMAQVDIQEEVRLFAHITAIVLREHFLWY